MAYIETSNQDIHEQIRTSITHSIANIVKALTETDYAEIYK